MHIQAGRDRRFVVDTWKKRFVSSHQWHDCPKSGLFPSFLGTQMHLNKDSPLKSKGFNPVNVRSESDSIWLSMSELATYCHHQSALSPYPLGSLAASWAELGAAFKGIVWTWPTQTLSKLQIDRSRAMRGGGEQITIKERTMRRIWQPLQTCSNLDRDRIWN